VNHLHTKNFIPIDIDTRKQPVRVKWLDIGKDAFDQNSFDESVQHCLSKSNSNIVETPLTELLIISDVVDRVKPTGFIYHMSRCGSTLLANMFRQLDKNIVHYEPLLPFKILELLNRDNEEYVFEVLKGAIDILGRKRFGNEENMVVKFSSGTTYFLPAILKVFPKVPRIYMYRDPVEVLVSNLENAAQPWIYDYHLTGQSKSQMLEDNSPLENCAYALAAKSEAFLRTYDDKCLIVEYEQIGRALLERVICHFNMSFSSAEVDEMMKAMDYYSKGKGEKFASDKDKKQRQASPKVRSVAERILGPVHENLKRLTVKL
jgi:hypothetical protein